MTRKPKVLVDLRGCHFEQERGISNYGSQLALAVAKTGRFECAFLAHRHRPRLRLTDALAALGPILWHEDLVTRGAPHIDAFLMTTIVHGLDQTGMFARNAIPETIVGRKPIVCGVVYDLIPLIFKDHYLGDPAIAEAYHNALRVLCACDHLFAISEATRVDTIEHLGVAPDCITTIPGGIDIEAWQAEPRPRDGTDVVYVGGENYRKNLDGLIAGFCRYLEERPDTKLSLSIVCKLRPETLAAYREAAGPARRKINILGFLEQKELVARVAAARASIFPSFYEGFGLPIVESYAVGTPVLASNNSSMRELVSPACQFDPYSQSAIVEAFAIIEDRADLLAESSAFGRNLLPRHTWDKTGARVADVIADLAPKRRQAAKPPFVAIVGALSPETTGVGHFTTWAFAGSRNDLVIFSPLRSVAEAAAKVSALQAATPRARLRPLDRMGVSCNAAECRAAVFVLGNSAHAAPALEQAVAFRARGIPIVLYLHEARVTGLLATYFDKDRRQFEQRLAEFYPEVSASVPPWQTLGLRLLHSLVGDARFIVNSKRCADLVIDDLIGFAAPEIDVLFLPMLTPPNASGRTPDGVLRIGHFGILDPLKSPDIVLAAARRLAKERPTRLLFAGYFCNPEHHAALVDADLVDWVDSPSDEELMHLIATTDVVVQPRLWDHGESSGVISQAISLGKIPVTSAGTAADELGRLTVRVPAGADMEAWVDAIHEALRRQADAMPSRDHLTLEVFGRAFDDVIDSVCETSRAGPIVTHRSSWSSSPPEEMSTACG